MQQYVQEAAENGRQDPFSDVYLVHVPGRLLSLMKLTEKMYADYFEDLLCIV